MSKTNLITPSAYKLLYDAAKDEAINQKVATMIEYINDCFLKDFENMKLGALPSFPKHVRVDCYTHENESVRSGVAIKLVQQLNDIGWDAWSVSTMQSDDGLAYDIQIQMLKP